jgi:membrane fusion protein, multidrug efflux system
LVLTHLMRYIVNSGVAALLSLLVLSCGCGPERGQDNGRAQPEIAVETARVVAADIPVTVEGIGSLEASKTVVIRSEIPGVIAEVRFEEGRRVAAGDLLYVLRDEKLNQELRSGRAALEAAQATMDQAGQTLERFDKLFEAGLIAAEEHNQARTAFETAGAEVQRLTAQLELRREQLRDARIRAPMDGLISESLLDPGDYVAAGDELATLYTDRGLRVAFSVPERAMGLVRPGQPVTIEVASAGAERFPGVVAYVSPGVDVRTRTLLVRASVEDETGVLRPGAFANAAVTVEVRRNRPTVPESSLVAAREGYSVFVVGSDGTASRRAVEIGVRTPGQAEILRGLEPGEIVVSSGQAMLSDGDPVRSGSGAER